ncbi:MAG: hypothetical protein OXC11_05110 [Rhodospirillales bacterium]|nr:hypothetical protein [Rhodospirillales bacterium]
MTFAAGGFRIAGRRYAWREAGRCGCVFGMINRARWCADDHVPAHAPEFVAGEADALVPGALEG